jgi:hypothetical protein
MLCSFGLCFGAVPEFFGLSAPLVKGGSGSSHQQAKIVRKSLNSTILLLYDFLSVKNDVNEPPKSN